MPYKNQSFSYKERLHLQKDYARVFKKGIRIDKKAVKILAYVNHQQQIRRLGLITPRKVGTAVIRNRTKRRLREIFRTNKQFLKPGLDVIFILKRETALQDYGNLKNIILSSLKNAKLFDDETTRP